jgi:ERCC4-type nuclease
VGLVQVLVDSREPPWVRKLTFGGAPVEVAPLEAGHVWAMLEDGALVAIERTSAGDFLTSLRTGRLIPRVAALRGLTEWAYLLITGTLSPAPGGTTLCDGRRTEWRWRAVTGAQLDVQELGVRVLHVAGEFDVEAEVVRLATRDRGPIRYGPPRHAAVLGEAESFLCALPGIGPEKARALLEHCQTGARALGFLVDLDTDVGKVPGVGEETRQRVRRALGFAEHDVFTIAKTFAYYTEVGLVTGAADPEAVA